YQGVGRQVVRHPGRGDERPDPADAVRFVPPHLAGVAAGVGPVAAGGLRGRHPRDGQGGRGRPGLRVERLPGQGPPPAAGEARRPAGDVQRGGLRHGDELQLQRPVAGRGGAGGRRPAPPDPPPRDLRGFGSPRAGDLNHEKHEKHEKRPNRVLLFRVFRVFRGSYLGGISVIRSLLRFGLAAFGLTVLVGWLAAQDEKPKPDPKQPPKSGDYRDFFKKPETTLEFWKAMQFEIEVGRYDLAAKHLHNMLDPAPDEKTLLDIANREGLSAFLALRNIPKW